jgi:hypothetical protein
MHVIEFQVIIVKEDGSNIFGIGICELAGLLHDLMDVSSYQQRSRGIL